MKLDLSATERHTFKEVATRLGCSSDDVRQLLLDEKLCPSYFLDDVRCCVHLLVPGDDHHQTGNLTPIEFADTDENNNFTTVYKRLKGSYFLVLKSNTNAYSCKYYFASPTPSDFQLNDFVYELNPPLTLDDVMANGYVMATELDRFLASQAGEKTPQRRTENTANTSAAANLAITTDDKISDPSDIHPLKRQGEEQCTRWPWGIHHTETLGHLEAAAKRFWVNYDPTDPSTAPLNEDVIQWLMARKVSRNMANSIATMLRVDGLKTGPRK